jgi:hypothetical protein
MARQTSPQLTIQIVDRQSGLHIPTMMKLTLPEWFDQNRGFQTLEVPTNAQSNRPSGRARIG